MNNSLNLIRSIIFLLTILFLINSCNSTKNEEPIQQLDNLNIDIGDGSIFNQSKFSTSFQQCFFITYYNWESNYTNVITNGKIQSTIITDKGFGSFNSQKKIFKHNYNTEGIITSSVEDKVIFDTSAPITLLYTYDNLGYLSTITFNRKGVYEFKINLFFNDKGQIVKQENDSETETYQYNSKNQIIKCTKVSYWSINDEQQKKEDITTYTFSFADNKVVRYTKTFNNESTFSTEYTYDKKDRIIEEHYLIDGKLDFYKKMKYQGNNLIMNGFNKNDKPSYVNVYGVTLSDLKSTKRYFYDFADGDFQYTTTFLTGNNGRIEFKEIYYGTIDNIELVGKSQIMEYHNLSLKKTKEKVMNVDGSTLYNVEFEIKHNEEGGNYYIGTKTFYDVDGNEISTSDISEDWVTQLVI
ncbi:hypothetical protein EI427_00605 [Flammeovirga pectinis]|uniref:DUF4595 domain-containing protein n=1 Tax=Flammeovirga pectinis TaxID=2494373 RepID=A0A3S9NXS6_9BACT|nr:hypothetical protein [Flammeovirga pectinis]AZQ60761.1 hypothetical protein EI427_00605 [Flammeovirga pectinis]